MGGESARTPAQAQVVSVVAVPARDGLKCCFAGPVLGILTHWHGGKSYACGGVEHCHPTIHKARGPWKGYAPVRVWQPRTETWKPFVLEVTEHLEEELRGRDLRGEVWELTRRDAKKKNSPVDGLFLELRSDPQLLVEFSVIIPLQRMYHQIELDLGTPNPLPAKLVLVETAAAAPAKPAPTAAPPADRPTEKQLEQLRELRAGLAGKPAQLPRPGTAAASNGRH